jgi:transcriptional regulator of acetoin/glycerol metabolism
MEEMVAQRLFRADLYYRLNAFAVHLPALRARTDFAAIVRHLMEAMASGTPITDAAIAALSRRKWPGNVRELRSVLQRALVGRHADYLDEDCFEGARSETEGVGDCCEECRNRPLSRARCEEIRSVHRRLDGNISKAARELGLSRTTVYKHVLGQQDHR